MNFGAAFGRVRHSGRGIFSPRSVFRCLAAELVTAHRDRVERESALSFELTPIAVDQPETMMQSFLATEPMLFGRLFMAIGLR